MTPNLTKRKFKKKYFLLIQRGEEKGKKWFAMTSVPLNAFLPRARKSRSFAKKYLPEISKAFVKETLLINSDKNR